MRRLAAPVRESRSARSWTWRSRTALRRLSAAIGATAPTHRGDPPLDARTARRPGARGRSRRPAGRRRPSARRAGCARPGRAAASTGLRVGIEPPDGEDLASLPGRWRRRSRARLPVRRHASTPCGARTTIRPSAAPTTRPRAKPKRSTSPRARSAPGGPGRSRRRAGRRHRPAPRGRPAAGGARARSGPRRPTWPGRTTRTTSR